MTKHLLSAVLVLVAACKPPAGDSTAKSLDNFAKDDGAAGVDNRCGRDVVATSEALPAHVKRALEVVDAPTNALKDAAASALTAVPERLMAPLLASGGRIRITDGAVADCGSTPLAEAERELAGNEPVRACWRQAEAGAAPEIVLAADETLVRHGVLRLFAYVYTEFFVKKISEPSAPSPFDDPEWRAAASGFKDKRGLLATALLSDLSAAGAQAYGRLKRFHDKDQVRFANFVLAEAVDSYYCSKAARDAFKAKFGGAWRQFTDASTPHSPVSVFGVAN